MCRAGNERFIAKEKLPAISHDLMNRRIPAFAGRQARTVSRVVPVDCVTGTGCERGFGWVLVYGLATRLGAGLFIYLVFS